jgi:hypothetical protein
MGNLRESLQGENRQLQTDYSIVPQSVERQKDEADAALLGRISAWCDESAELILLACSLPWKSCRVRFQVL